MSVRYFRKVECPTNTMTRSERPARKVLKAATLACAAAPSPFKG